MTKDFIDYDLEKLTHRIFIRAYLDSEQEVSKWINDYVKNRTSALTARVEELTRERDALKIELSNYAYQMDMAKRERDKAEQENARLTERLQMNSNNV